MKQKAKTPSRICLLFSQNNRPDRERLSGVLRYASVRTDWEVRVLDRSSQTFEKEAASIVHGWKPDGIICTADFGSREALKLVAASGSVKIAIDPPDNDLPSGVAAVVRTSTGGIFSRVRDLFIRRGFANFGYYGTEAIDECDYSISTEQQFKGAILRSNRKCAVHHELPERAWTDRLTATANWVKDLPKPCGVLAYSDELARNLLDACRLAGVSVPEQIAIVGVDDSSDICESCRPTLSSVQLDFEQSGYLAAEALQRHLAGKRSPHAPQTIRNINCSITERASTQDLRGCGRIVSAASELIRTMSLSELSVDAICSRLHVSRRLLEMHFRKVIGKTLRDEIATRRLETIRQRLRRGNERLTTIIAECGFRTRNAAQIAYRKRFGHAMSAERTSPSRPATPPTKVRQRI